MRPSSRFGPRLQSPARRIGAGWQLKPCRCSISSSSSLCCWTLALGRDFPSEVRCQVVAIPGKCSTLKHASSAGGACSSCWRPDQVGVPPMFLWSCLPAAAPPGPTTGGGACGSSCCGSWQQPALWRSCCFACTTPALPLLEDKGIRAPVLMFPLLLLLPLLSPKHPLAA